MLARVQTGEAVAPAWKERAPLFEAFVGRSLKAALASRSIRLQHSDRYALTAQGYPLFSMRPDIVVDDDTIIDTKWKELKPADPVVGVYQSDVYQMLAYARAYEARRLILLYPWHKGLPAPGICRRWQVAGTTVPFDIATVDIGSPGSVPQTLREIVDGSQPAMDSQMSSLSPAA